MILDFSDRVILITGAAGSLGTAVARAFHASGARLALADRSPEHLSKRLPELAAERPSSFLPATDVTDPDSVKIMVEKTLDHFGRIDALINIAGGYRAGQPLHETPLGDWDAMLDLNARSVWITCHAVIPHLLRQGAGKIINIASRAATHGEAYHAAYSVSKAAVLRLTETLAAELKNAGINVNCVMPGLIDTPANREAMPGADRSTWVAPDALADVILFLASDAARAVQGAAIPVYGRG
ncbi:MAG TPA: SDR family NAD(P)-dependent oxidoreductase [Blastocatellia bacterium]|nr:SDR family NAD(P)-dependent oxidoreductase [Blastocatellia bacterium]